MRALAVCLNPTFQITMNYNNIIPGEVNRAISHRLDASGKGMNVARVLVQLNKDADYFTHLGGLRKNEFLDLAKNDNVNITWDESNSSIRSCITVLESENSRTTEFVQEPEKVSEGTEQRIKSLYLKIIADYDIIVFSGTKAPGYSKNIIPELVKTAKENNKIVILDIKGDDLKLSLDYKPDYIKPNLSEFYSTFIGNKTICENNKNLEIKTDVEKIAKELWEKYSTKAIITRGKFPVWYYDGSTFGEINTKTIKAVNTIGCGDAFTAGLTAGLMENKNLHDCLKIGVETSAKVAECQKPGSLLP